MDDLGIGHGSRRRSPLAIERPQPPTLLRRAPPG